MSTQPRTARGNRTRAKILAAAEQVFAEVGYHDASIVKITESAGVGQGTFYLYFESKIDVFDELVDDLNRRVRHAMIEASSQATTRLDAERAGFEAFCRRELAHFKVPRRFDLVPSLPRTSLHKVSRRSLVERVTVPEDS